MMEIRRTPPRRARNGPSCLLVLVVIVALIAGVWVISNADTVRETIILPPTPEPTRSAASYAASAALLERDGEFDEARPDRLREYQAHISGARLEIILDAAHASLSRQPERYREVLDNFLQSVEAD